MLMRAVLLSILLTTVCISHADEVVDASIMSLIAAPEKFQGKKVAVTGIGNIAFEGNSIWFHREDREIGNIANALWLNLTDEQKEMFEGCSDMYIDVIGVFDGTRKGHLGMYQGEITVERMRINSYEREKLKSTNQSKHGTPECVASI